MSTTVNRGVPSLRKPLRRVDRSVRHALVLAMYGGYAVAAILWHISRTHHSTTLAVASFTVLAAALAATLTAFYRTGYWTWSLTLDSCPEQQPEPPDRAGFHRPPNGVQQMQGDSLASPIPGHAQRVPSGTEKPVEIHGDDVFHHARLHQLQKPGTRRARSQRRRYSHSFLAEHVGATKFLGKTPSPER